MKRVRDLLGVIFLTVLLLSITMTNCQAQGDDAKTAPFYLLDKDTHIGDFVVKSIKGIDYISVNDLSVLLRQVFNIDEGKWKYIDNKSNNGKAEYQAVNSWGKIESIVLSIKDNKVYKSDLNGGLSLADFGVSFVNADGRIYFPLQLVGLAFFDCGLQLYNSDGSYYLFNQNSFVEQLLQGGDALKTCAIDTKLTPEARKFTFLYFMGLCKKYYPNLKGKGIDYEQLKKKYLAMVLKAKDNNHFYALLSMLIDEFKDDHTNIESHGHSYKFSYNGYMRRMLIGDIQKKPYDIYCSKKRLMIKKYAQSDGGHELTEINGVNPYELPEYKLYSASGTDDLFGKWISVFWDKVRAASPIIHSVKSRDGAINIDFELNKITVKEINDQIAYMHIPTFIRDYNDFTREISDKIYEVKDKKGVIIDVRGNGGGFLIDAEYLLQSLVMDKYKIYNKKNNTVFDIESEKKSSDYFDGKLVLLTDSWSYSASNLVAAAFRLNQLGDIIGETTKGGGYIPECYVLPDNTVVRISSRVVLTDEKGNDFENGVKPDLFVKNAFVDDVDQVLEAAIKRLEERLQTNSQQVVNSVNSSGRLLGGDGNDVFRSVVDVKDGWVVAGETSSRETDDEFYENRAVDGYLVKFNKAGKIQWQKRYGASTVDRFSAVAQTDDNGYVAVGDSFNYQTGTEEKYQNCYVIKTDKDGNVQWEKHYNISNGDDIANAVVFTKDGGYLVTGQSNDLEKNSTYCFALKLNKDGEIEWQKLFGSNGTTVGRAVIQRVDGNFILAGTSDCKELNGVRNKGGFDYYILQIDKSGNTKWQKLIGGSADEEALGIKETPDGGYALVGYSYSKDIPGTKNTGDADVYIVKFTRDNKVAWQNLYGGGGREYAFSLTGTDDNGYIVGGYSWSKDIKNMKNNGMDDAYILKVDSKGKLLWQKNYGGKGDDMLFSVAKDQSGNFMAVGMSDSNDLRQTNQGSIKAGYLLKIDSQGNLAKD